jgi:hypothetical protein
MKARSGAARSRDGSAAGKKAPRHTKATTTSVANQEETSIASYGYVDKHGVCSSMDGKYSFHRGIVQHYQNGINYLCHNHSPSGRSYVSEKGHLPFKDMCGLCGCDDRADVLFVCASANALLERWMMGENIITISWLWNHPKSEGCWKDALWRYDEIVLRLSLEQRAIEQKIAALDYKKIKNVCSTVRKFYKFLYTDYFPWIFMHPHRIASTRKELRKYDSENFLAELNDIRKELFSPLFDVNDISKGLRAAMKIRGLGPTGASGLLAVLFPDYYATVSRGVVFSFQQIKFRNAERVQEINPKQIRPKDAVVLIELMKEKSVQLNKANSTDFWTPRKIDMVLDAHSHFADKEKM